VASGPGRRQFEERWGLKGLFPMFHSSTTTRAGSRKREKGAGLGAFQGTLKSNADDVPSMRGGLSAEFKQGLRDTNRDFLVTFHLPTGVRMSQRCSMVLDFFEKK
jgi:hypothetical protein